VTFGDKEWANQGGFIGHIAGPVTNCYYAGVVTVAPDGGVGGGFHGNGVGPITSSYFDVEVGGIAALDSAGSSTQGGLTTAEMMQEATYVGWDFANVWSIDEGQGYPRLPQPVAIPVGHWKLDETSGEIAQDSSGNGYDGILSADPAPLWTTDPGRGNVLEFGPGLDYVDCGPGVSAGQDLTVALWIKPANVELMRPISCFDGDDYSENPGWFLMLRHDDWGEPPQVPPNAWFRMTGTEGEWNSGDLWINECWAPDEWVHMAFTFDEDTDTLSGYINGQLAGVTVVPEGRGVASDTNPLIMGHGGGVEQYEGLMDEVRIYDVVLTAAEIWNLVYPIAIPVPNGNFEEIYKPGSDTITADLGEGWTQGVGPNTPMDDGIATYSDGTTGNRVDIPGWVGADAQGWIDNGGTYGRDTTTGNRQGSVARQIVTPDGLCYYLSNGGDWGNPAGGLIVSDAPVATVENGLTYVLSMLATGPDGPATPVVLELLADGVALTPSSSVDPQLSGDWKEFSRTYDAASLAGHIGESLTIRLGVGRGASGGQTCFDAVSLSYVEPIVSLVENFDSLAVGSQMQGVNGWEGWFGDAKTSAKVTNAFAHSGTNSLEIVGNRDDLVPHWPQQTTGQWTLKVMQYCPSGKQTTGLVYFGPLTVYDAATQTVGWIGEFIADFQTGKAYCNQDKTIQVDLVYNAWVELRLEVDLDSQVAHLYYNNVYLATRPAPSVAGVDIWPDENIKGVYFDDFSFAPAQ